MAKPNANPRLHVLRASCGCRLWFLAGTLLCVCHAAAAFADDRAPTQREIVKRAMSQRGDDPWPRGAAHVVLAIPGSQQPEKGYHEPGGSFSPAVGSFGV